MANKKRAYLSTKIGGKQRTMHFSMNFWGEFCELRGISLEQIGDLFQKGLSIIALRDLVYSGLAAYDLEQGNEIDYTKYNVGEWLDDFTGDQLNEVMTTVLESRILGNDLNMGIERKAKRTTKGK